MTKLKVNGMTCNHCVMAVTKALQAVDGVATVVEVNLEKGEATVEGNADAKALADAVTEEGYEAEVVT